MAAVASFTLHIDHFDGYQFRTHFDKEQYEELYTDEPAPLGQDSAPNPARILAAAIGNCLAASLLFCLSRSGVKPTQLAAEVQVELVRNEKRRLRVGLVDVKLKPQIADTEQAVLEQCHAVFEDFCVVTQSVREGLEVRVELDPAVATS